MLKDIDQRKKEIQEDLDRLKTLKYKVGEPVVHKNKGNCIIMDYFVPIEKYDLTRDPGHLFPKVPANVGYIICGPGLHEVVEEKDLLPYNKTTKVLFNE